MAFLLLQLLSLLLDFLVRNTLQGIKINSRTREGTEVGDIRNWLGRSGTVLQIQHLDLAAWAVADVAVVAACTVEAAAGCTP